MLKVKTGKEKGEGDEFEDCFPPSPPLSPAGADVARVLEHGHGNGIPLLRSNGTPVISSNSKEQGCNGHRSPGMANHRQSNGHVTQNGTSNRSGPAKQNGTGGAVNGSYRGRSPSRNHQHRNSPPDAPRSNHNAGVEEYHVSDDEEDLGHRGYKIISMVSRQQATIPVVWPARNEEAFQRGKKVLQTLQCDALSFTTDDLVHLTLEIFLEIGLPQRLKIPIEKMQRFILGVRDRMLDNPYHNWPHAFDVTQTVYSLGVISNILPTLNDMECFALLVSAMCHDLEHPGVNNLFLIKSRSSLAALYNETSILEKHHSFRAFELMLHSNIELLSGLSHEEFAEFREMVMSVILATDMARHSTYMAKLKNVIEPNGDDPEQAVSAEEKSRFHMEILIKCADTSNVLKPFDIAKRWAMRVTDEFFLQGDMERANGMDVTPMCDRSTQSRVALQKGFIDHVIGPYYAVVGKFMPELAKSFEQIQSNRQSWDEYNDERLTQEVGNTYTAELPGIINEGPMSLRVVTWNIAAVNNNPFEYWITHKEQEYARLMHDVQVFIDNPGDRDFRVSEIISDEMIAELKQELQAANLPGLDEWEHRWQTEYKDRMSVCGFLKDKVIGSKRLISMPDRITNTINSEGRIFMRPSVVSMFDGDMTDFGDWWRMWIDFMFHTEVHILDRLCPGVYTCMAPVQMIQPIKNSKYPAISAAEEKISIPLQVLALAIFDGVLLRILHTVAKDTWQKIKQSLCEAFNQNKGNEVINILNNKYGDGDVIFIQEAAAAFVDNAKAVLGKKYMVLRPYLIDAYRNQNSIILAKRDRFVEGSTIDVTEQVCRLADEGKWTAPGDLCVMAMKGVDGSRYLLASFHGDTNGMATVPVLKALHGAVTSSYPDHVLIFGMDANTHKTSGPNTLGIDDFHSKFTEMGFSSCWGEKPGLNCWTTRNARTYLQPQLQKAVGMADAARKGDVNLKDWIVFYSRQLKLEESIRDNTGNREFNEDMVFPTLKFPSDHAIVSTFLKRLATDKQLKEEKTESSTEETSS